MNRSGLRATVTLALAAIAALPASGDAGAADSGAKPASIAELMAGVDIPHQRFQLDNGLTVLVHEDHKAPIVAVAAWYNVGSKDEPPGRTGFAHLFEHIGLFNGTEHVPNLIEPLREMGATNWNGTTWFDRTNYFQTVPTQALERALYIESERMGYLLGALTQERLDAQRGVVQNEKRQGDNQPYGLGEYRQLEALFPVGHPYRHSTIGAMADLDAASLADVRGWFRDNYGPNNAVFALAGDITLADAKRLVQQYFGQVPRGPQHTPADAPVPTLAAAVNERMHDRVANTRIERTWVVPGQGSAVEADLTIAASVLGGLASSRLDRALVREDQSAVAVSAYLLPFQRVSLFALSIDVRPGGDADALTRRLDALVADFIKEGPSADEIQRAATQEVARGLLAIEQIGGFTGKAWVLADGAIMTGDAGYFRSNLLGYGKVTPDSVRKAMGQWLARPAHTLRTDPGEREPYVEATADQRPAPDATKPSAQPRAPMPEVGTIADLDFPDVQRACLANGIEIVYANRGAIPATLVAAEFDAGVAADPAQGFGTQKLVLSALTEGAAGRDAIAIAEQQERLGATITASGTLDRSIVSLVALSANLGPSLDLFADIVRQPDFPPAEVERLRNQQLAAIAAEGTQPLGLAQRTLPALIWGTAHPYARPSAGLGSEASVKALDRAALRAFHERWIRPETARLFVVSDRPLAEVREALDARFGTWKGAAGAPGRKDFSAPIPAPNARIVLVDRPQSPQSVIYAGTVLPLRGSDDTLALIAANEILGASFLSRINTEIRERRGWSYGLSGQVALLGDRVPYIVNAPVQADRTGDAIRVLIEQYDAFRADKGVTESEHMRTINGNIRQLPGAFETAASILNALRQNDLYKRPDDYWERVVGRYRAMSGADMDQAARAAIDPATFTWVVVGDAAVVCPQLKGLKLPVELQAAERPEGAPKPAC